MANAYKKVYIHLIFAVKNRNALLNESWRGEVFSYIAGVINTRGHYSLAVNGYLDHIHILLDYGCHELIPDLVRELKKSSSSYIKTQRLSRFKFEWQSGYGVFSIGYKDKDKVINYIINQKEHHNKKTFRSEYMSLLKTHKIDFEYEYVFDFME